MRDRKIVFVSCLALLLSLGIGCSEKRSRESSKDAPPQAPIADSHKGDRPSAGQPDKPTSRRVGELVGTIESRFVARGPGRAAMTVPHLVTGDKVYELRTSLKDTRWVNVQKIGGQYIFYRAKCRHRVHGRLDEKNDKVIWATRIEDIDEHPKAETRPAGSGK